MRTPLFLILMIGILSTTSSFGQQKVGVNTTTPLRTLEIFGSGDQDLRIHSTTNTASHVALELLRGSDASSARDWKIQNTNGIFKIITGNDNFETSGYETFRIATTNYVGIGSINPETRLTVDNGETASNTEDGVLMLGSKTSYNLIFDENKIMARNNSSPSSLYLQSAGGNTWFGSGDIRMGLGGGKIIVGSSPLNAKLNVDGISYQTCLKNNVNGINDWYIGASNASWLIGDNQLVFNPTTSHLNSTLRLMDVTDNNGSEAPVMITSPSSQTLLIDGNEIDTRTTPLYINHNSNNNTYINPSGGRAAAGTSDPDAVFHIQTNEYGIALQRALHTWWIAPTIASNLNFYKNTSLLAYVSHAGGGEWVAVSDRNLKDHIERLYPVMDKINHIKLYRYNFIQALGGSEDIGVIAQEIEPVFPEAVSYGNDQYGVAYDELTAVAMKGIQEHQIQLQQLLNEADALLNKN